MYKSCINIIFRQSGVNIYKNAPIMVSANPEEKVSEIIKKYRMKSGDQDLTEKYIFNAKDLNQDLTVSEAGITNNANIFVAKMVKTNIYYSQQKSEFSNINNNYYDQNSHLNNERRYFQRFLFRYKAVRALPARYSC